MPDLLDAAFLESLAALRIVARRVPRGGRLAEQRSLDLGGGIELRDFRSYSPGDDVRAIDWNIYRRLGRVFLRLFEELEDLPHYLMPDVSRSLFVESPPRARAGLRCALALASVSLDQHDRVGLFPFGGGLTRPMPPAAGRGRLLRLARHLQALQPAGATDIARSLAELGARRLRPGLLTVISDFFDPAGIGAVTEALRTCPHKLLLVQLTRKTDRLPSVTGDLRLVDAETGTAEDVTVTDAVLRRYRMAYDAFEGELTLLARQRPAGLLRLDVDEPIVPQLAALFEAGRYVA